MRLYIKTSVVIISLLLGISCKKETSWDIDAAIPIARSHLNISNFFGDTIFKSDPTGLVHINFSKEVLNLSMDSLVNLPDTTVSIGYTALFNSFLTPGSVIYTNAGSPTNQEIAFDVPNGVQLNKANVRSGYLKIEYFNTYSQPLNFIYDINSAKLWGNVFHVDQTISGGSVSSPATLTKLYSLANYSIDLTGLSLNKVNTLVQTYSIKTDASGSADNLLIGQGLNIKLSFIDIVPEYVQGYFGQQDISIGPDSAYFGLLNNFNTSNFKLTQSSINFNIINEFGVELSSTISKVKSVKSSPYTSIYLNTGSMLQSLNINRAGKTNLASNPVFPFIKQIALNNTNTNLNPFLENLPNYIGYQVRGKLNPLGNVSAGNDFAYYGHGLKVFADIDIPLALSADYFGLTNYAKVDLQNNSQLKNVNSCELVLQAKNNYPFTGKIQGYIIDENNIIIDSLYSPTENTIQSAITDVTNTVISPVDSKIVSVISNTKLENLRKCKQIKFVSYLYLPNQPTPIKIKSDSYLDIILSANVNYRAVVK